MRKALLLVILFFSLGLTYAQTESKFTKIINGGSIRSTPKICENKAYLADLVLVTDAEFAAQLCPFADESHWPTALSTLEKRNSGARELMKDYNIYYVADIGSDAVLLWIPMEINQHMPKEMRDKTDFLVMIGKDAVVLGDKVSMYGTNEDANNSNGNAKSEIEINAQGFNNQLINIVTDFGQGFKNLKGLAIKSDSEYSFTNSFISHINLEGSEESYFSEDILSNDLSFISSFGNFSKKEDAIVKYKQLILKIDKIAFPCCTFEKNDEYLGDVLINQSYLPFDLAGAMPHEFDNILIEVEILKGFNLSQDYKLIDQWSVILRVRKNN